MSVINQKRIAKNTLLLYVRMGLIMLISLYTSRVVLRCLGETDFGLYNVVGGIVVSFSFLNGIMSAACQRYFAIELGKGDTDNLNRVFKLNITVFIGVGLLILLLSETLGLWFLNSKMTFPDDRYKAVQWVYQLSILTFAVNMMSTPYRSIIIAKEKMNVFAYSSVIEAILRLVIALLIIRVHSDKLIFYSFLMSSISIGTSLFYWAYCRAFYKECRYSFFWDKALFKDVVGYTGWNILTAMANIGKSQGINIVLNMFFGPAVNAARGISYQVYVNVNQFFTNFTMAINPQIIKSYGAREYSEMQKLVFQSSRFSYYLLFFVSLPVFFETPALLDLWLGSQNVPDHTILFTRLILINALIDTLGNCMATAIQATGQIKWYQIFVGCTLLLIIPVGYLFYKFTDVPPETILFVSIIFSAFVQLIRLYFVKKQLNFDMISYLKMVITPILLVSIVSVCPTVAAKTIFSDYGWGGTLGTIIVALFSSTAAILFIGVTTSERSAILNLIKSKFYGTKQ